MPPMTCFDMEVLLLHHGYFHAFRAVLPPRATKMNVSMWVLCKHLPMVQQPSVYSHVTEQKHVKRSYDGIVANESDVLLCERPRLWLDHTKLVTFFHTAENHEQASTGCQGVLDPA